MPPLSNSLPDLMKLAAETSFTDDDALEVLGHCVLVCVMPDPKTPPTLKKELAKTILQSLKRPNQSREITGT
jgi:hypothetical protein